VDALLTELNCQSHSDGTAADDNNRLVSHRRSLRAFCWQWSANGLRSMFPWQQSLNVFSSLQTGRHLLTPGNKPLQSARN